MIGEWNFQPTAEMIRDVLLRQGLAASRIESIGGGFVSWTFDIDDAWIVQLPRFDTAIQTTRMQIRLMPEVQAAVPFAVPVPELIAEWESRPVIRYRKVPGRPLTETDQWPPIAAMLRTLHSVPATRAAPLLGCEPSPEAWRTRHAQFRDLMEQALLPQLDTQLGAVISQHYAQFLDDPLDFTPCFVHCDLGAEHILVDPQTRRPAGLIDFDWSAVGDPAIDFVGVF